MDYIDRTSSLSWSDQILLEILMHPNMNETYESLSNSTLEYVWMCLERIRIDNYKEKDLKYQEYKQQQQANAKNPYR